MFTHTISSTISVTFITVYSTIVDVMLCNTNSLFLRSKINTILLCIINKTLKSMLLSIPFPNCI